MDQRGWKKNWINFEANLLKGATFHADPKNLFIVIFPRGVLVLIKHLKWLFKYALIELIRYNLPHGVTNWLPLSITLGARLLFQTMSSIKSEH
jgi:hypothetical protein